MSRLELFILGGVGVGVRLLLGHRYGDNLLRSGRESDGVCVCVVVYECVCVCVCKKESD